MIERFFPDKEVNKVEKISLENLKEKNIKGLILDIDNTISEWRLEPTDDVIAWLEMLRRNDIKICLVSNNRRTRVEKLSTKLSIHAIHSAFKPRRKAFIAALSLMGTKPEETVVVGDQIFTDVYGGNRLNMYTIYVSPISHKDNWFVQMKRPFERYILNKFRTLKFTQNEKRLIWKEKSLRKKIKN